MKVLLNWKRGAFSTTYHIYSGEEHIGELSDRTFKQIAEGRIRQKKYQFLTKGFFKQETRIIDGDTHEPIGHITYNSMMTRATIQYAGKSLNWSYDNRWQSKWSIYNDAGIRMKFTGRSTRGSIEYENADDLLVLTGLFVTNYYQQAMIAILVAVFIPIWVSLFS